MATHRTDSGPRRALVYALVLVWTVVFSVRTWLGHTALGTNAYDLSVFDYSLWSTIHGAMGRVPFMGQSIFSHHVMPILFVLAPVYTLWQSPVLLIVVQIGAFVGAALVFMKLQTDVIGLSWARSTSMVAVFLLARRSHGGVASFFYPECLQPVLVFGLLLAWHRSKWLTSWILAVLFLMTKEDAALYLAAFGLVQAIRPEGSRRQAAITSLVACVWFALAMFVALPASRTADGLDSSNAIVADRFGGPAGVIEPGTLARRLVSGGSVRTLGAILLGVGFLPLAAPESLLAAAPGLLANLAAREGTMQATLTGHYAWAVLPWLFAAAAWGLCKLEAVSPRTAMIWTTLLLIGTCVDSPLIQHLFVIPDVRSGLAVRAQLETLPPVGTVLAQPNLVPHLPHSSSMFTVDGRPQPRDPNLVLLSKQGDLWPLTSERVDLLIDAYRHDSRYRPLTNGPLYAFIRN